MKKQIFKSVLIGFIALMTLVGCKKDVINNNNNNAQQTPLTVTDTNGNIYHTVNIGRQIWMTENLKTTKFSNGDSIPDIIDNEAWNTNPIAACCNYNNDTNITKTYGRLYNWYAVGDSRNICPTGWHVPTNSEWDILINYMGGDSIAGGKLKEKDTTHWESPNAGATNAIGFTALPGGNRVSTGFCMAMGQLGLWWSATELNANVAWHQSISRITIGVQSNTMNKDCGISVRCIKD